MINGTYWKDTDGNGIQAHGGCLLFHGDTFYWYGENKETETREGRTDFMGFSCYSSRDLIRWRSLGIVLNTGEHGDLSPLCVGERPKVLYNEKTGRFVMWFHLDSADYTLAHVGIAWADRPQGPFHYQGKMRPGGMRESRDMTLFQDRDKTAYLISSSDGNASLLISQLDDTYTGFTGNTKTILEGQFREAPVLFCHENYYYLLTSGCTGWIPNPPLYAVAESIMGRWRLIDNPCLGEKRSTCYGGQPAHVVTTPGGTAVLLDHWKPENLRESGYSLLPVRFEETGFRLLWAEEPVSFCGFVSDID